MAFGPIMGLNTEVLLFLAMTAALIGAVLP